MDMINLSRLLKHYKRRELQNEMVEAATDREVGVRFNHVIKD